MGLDPKTNALLAAQQRNAKAGTPPEEKPLDLAFPYTVLPFPITTFGVIFDETAPKSPEPTAQ